LGAEINMIADQIDKPFIPTEIVLDEGNLKIKEGELGMEVDKNELGKDIVNSLKKYLMGENNIIPVKIIYPGKWLNLFYSWVLLFLRPGSAGIFFAGCAFLAY